uniref:Uncharacterized protein n=1 Tax=Sphaerodactylus townsendi TaxID=933632 RepID=A0ACB8FGY6_9SAUR
MERELSESLERLISFMLKLNQEETKPAVTFHDVIKICEDHFLKPSEAADHYTVICQVLFAEYIELQKLMLTIQSCKEAGLWQDVLGGLQKGARLHKVMEHPQPQTHLKQCACSVYNAVVDDIKNKHYTLHKVSTRELKERVCQAPSLHEQLMREVKNPPKLRTVSAQKSKTKQIEDDCELFLNTPCNTFFDQNGGTKIVVSKAKKPRFVWLVTMSSLYGLTYAIFVAGKVTMPVRPCIRLPLNFFKVIRLCKEDLTMEGQKTMQMLYEIEHWDCSRVPLVLEPHCLSPPLASRTRTMMNWPSLDVCVKCEQHLLEILSHQVQQRMPHRKRSLSLTEWE